MLSIFCFLILKNHIEKFDFLARFKYIKLFLLSKSIKINLNCFFMSIKYQMQSVYLITKTICLFITIINIKTAKFTICFLAGFVWTKLLV